MTATLKLSNPADGSPIDEIPADDAASVARKATEARRAQPAWAARPLAERKANVVRFRAAVAAELEALAETLTREVGKPLAQSRNELNGFLGRIDFFLDQVEAATAPQTVLADAAMTERIDHEPLGVVANISAWNYPYFVGGNVFVPALLTGNAVLYKPSEFAALTGLHIARLLHGAGVPEAVFATLVGAGDVGCGAAGATAGRRVLHRLGGHGREDRGGNGAAHGAPAARARRQGPDLRRRRRRPQGRGPVARRRRHVQHRAELLLGRAHLRPRAHPRCLRRALRRHGRGLPGRRPARARTYIGPITRPAQMAVLASQVADAVARGARLCTGGKRIERAGHWFEPTVLTQVDHSMAVMREESFGPLIGIQKVSGDDEALALMNDTRYGLTAGMYTRDEARAARLLAQVNAGSVYWNCCDRVSPRLPWSGHGDSGVGVTLSTYGIQAFTRPRAWHLRSP
jgi:acyl-CoA reductase-like NAD-dependent aldehyde dehydrogenase